MYVKGGIRTHQIYMYINTWSTICMWVDREDEGEVEMTGYEATVLHRELIGNDI